MGRTRLTLLVLALAALSGAVGAEERVHLTREEALLRALPGVVRLESALVTFTEAERTALKRNRRVIVPEAPHSLLRGFDDDGALIGYAMFVDEIGKFRPITFVVALDPQLRTRDVAVTVYRESHGGEITRRRFLRQFEDKNIGDRLRLGREVIHISGATLSCRATIRAVERVLAISEQKCDGDRGFSALRFVEARAPEVGVAPTVHTERRLAMGTVLEVTIDHPEPLARRAAQAVFDEVEEVRSLLDGRCVDSDIARLLAAPAATPVTMSARTIECLTRALEVSSLSEGRFDPTLIDQGWRELEIDANGGTVARSARVTRIDLGGIGKGYALDRAAVRLRELGADRAILNFGGQILALEPPVGSTGWTVAIAAPANDGSFIEVDELARTSLACSGAMHRGSHIIDPGTGRPAVVPELTTVHANDATTADAWSTACAIAPDLSAHALAQDASLQRVGRWERTPGGAAEASTLPTAPRPSR